MNDYFKIYYTWLCIWIFTIKVFFKRKKSSYLVSDKTYFKIKDINQI